MFAVHFCSSVVNIGVIFGGSVAGVLIALALVVTIAIVVAVVVKLNPRTESEWYILLGSN